MKLNKYILIVTLLVYVHAYPQSNSASKLKLIESVKAYCIDELNMTISKEYYTNWANSEKPNYYLYVSRKDSIINGLEGQRPFKTFRHRLEDAKIKKEKYDALGYSTLLYKTYGTAATKLSKHLLSYSNESIAFIAFHEATHQHIAKHGSIPYSLIEATCDLVGNYGALKLSDKNKELSNNKTQKLVKDIESISLKVNNLITKITTDYSAINNDINKLKKGTNKFTIERYNYNVNNAYLLRNRSYTIHYFKLKKILMQTNNLKTFLQFVTHLPNDELKCIQEIDKKIKSL